MKFALVLSLTVIFAPLATAADVQSSSRAEKFIQNYYQRPNANNVAAALHMLSREGRLSDPSQVARNIGFLSSVFAQNPDRVNAWLSQTAELPEADRRVIAAAAWQAGNARGERLLKDMARTASPQVAQEIAGLVQRGSTPLTNMPVLSESSMNLHWGAFLANGDDRHVLAVLNAFGSGQENLSSSARFSLAQNAARHDRVMQVVRAQLDKQPEPLREELRAALNAAATSSNGS